jgi:hypothetical protein
MVGLFNLYGVQVFSGTCPNATSVAIDLTDKTTGIYVVKVIADGNSYYGKILKE